MARKGLIEREKKRELLVTKFSSKKEALIGKLKSEQDPNVQFALRLKLQEFPRNSAKNRVKSRCWKTGRARGFFRYFGVCRNVLRAFAHDCLVPGLIKSSW